MSPVHREPKRRALRSLCSCMVVSGALLLTSSLARGEEHNEPLRLVAKPNAQFAASGSGFFVNADGDIVTAKHVVEECKRMYAVQSARVVRADLAFLSRESDIALLRSSLKPLLIATLARDPGAEGRRPVFSGSYARLQDDHEVRNVFYNALLTDWISGSAAEFSMISNAELGSSGSAVLDESGLVLGIVSRRHVTAGGTGDLLRGGAGTFSTVVGVSSAAIRAFLDDKHVEYRSDDGPELSLGQALGPRARSLAVGILCGR